MQYTYEFEKKNQKYETYEWDNTWLEHANYPELKRVLYIGDSITCQIRVLAEEKTNNKIIFDLFGTSKAIDNPYFKNSIKLFGEQQNRRDAVLFNNGLHGRHLTREEYKIYYEDMLSFLLEEFKNTPIILVLSTHISEDIEYVIERNEVIKEMASKYNLPIIDLFSVSSEVSYLHQSDGVHFSTDGSKILADKVVESLMMYVPSLKEL